MQDESFADVLPTRGIAVWIVIGAIFVVAALVGTWALIDKGIAESERYAGCQTGVRTDCQWSLFWSLFDGGRTGDPSSDRAASVGTENNGGKRAVRSSDSAPTIYSVKPEGVGIDGQGYRIKKGERVTFTVNAQDAMSVELFFKTTQTNASSSSLIVLQPKQTENDYAASLTWNQDQAGELEIRAQGKEAADRASLFIPISVETN